MYYFLVYKWWHVELHITVVKRNLCFYSSAVSLSLLAKWLWQWSLLCRFIYLSPAESQRVQIPPVKTTDFAIYGKSSAGKETDLELVKTHSEELPGFAGQRQAKVFLSHTIHIPLRLICFEFPVSVCTDPIIGPTALLRFLSENKPRQSAEEISRPLVWKPLNTVCPAREIGALSMWVIHWLHRNISGWIFF